MLSANSHDSIEQLMEALSWQPPYAWITMNATQMMLAMNDSEVSTTLSYLTNQDYQRFRVYIHSVVGSVVVVLGLLGNTLSIGVFIRDKTSNIMHFLLVVLAMADNGVLLFYGISRCLHHALVYYNINSYVVTIPTSSIFFFCRMISIWMTVLIAFVRFVAVCFPLHCRHWLTLTRVKRITCVMIMLISLMFLPGLALLINTYWTDSQPKQTSTYRLIPSNMLTLVDAIVIILAMGLLCVFGTLLLIGYHRSKKFAANNRTPNHSSRKDDQITIITILIIVVFICCHLPKVLRDLMNVYCEDIFFPSYHQRFIHWNVGVLLIPANSAVNFIIYSVSRPQFRKQLYTFWCRCDRAIHDQC